MNTYEFPYFGSGGPGDSWDGIIDVEMSDEDYARIEDSIRGGCTSMREDQGIADIYGRIYQMVIDMNLEVQRSMGMIDELREDCHCGEDATEREVIEAYLERDNCVVTYPYDLQERYWETDEEDEDEEEWDEEEKEDTDP